MAFLGHYAVRCELFVENKCLQQAKNFKYLGCEISYRIERNIKQKLSKFAKIIEIFNSTFNS